MKTTARFSLVALQGGKIKAFMTVATITKLHARKYYKLKINIIDVT